MLFPLKKLFLNFSFNISLFLILMIGIQNSLSKSKVNFIITDSVSLPISFIVGVSFISGSITGTLLNLNFSNKKG